MLQETCMLRRCQLISNAIVLLSSSVLTVLY